MKISLSHPTGNQNVRAVISSFYQSGILEDYSTTFAVNPKALWLKLLSKKLRQECFRRTYPIPYDKIWTHPAYEFLRTLLQKARLHYFVEGEHSLASVDAVYRNFDNAVARRLKAKKNRVTAVYTYEDAALSTFIYAKEIGVRCIYDLPIAYWETGRKLMLGEAERLPLWAKTLGGGIHDSKEKLNRKVQELHLADMIVCPSKFVMDSLPESAKLSKRIVVAPFGSPVIKPVGTEMLHLEKSNHSRPLRILFAGSLSQRKGLGDLFAAIKLVNRPDVELVVMGALQAPMHFYRKELSNFTYEPGRPHNDVLALMSTCDIFCLPSIVEGRALVMQEAMMQELPIIITPNTGGEDLIVEGKTGFLVPISSPEAIAEKITWFLENRLQIPEMGKLAQAHAATYTWENYGRSLITEISKFLN